MEFLYSDILPLKISKQQRTIHECLVSEFSMADSVEIAVGYVSMASLEELDKLVNLNSIKNIILTIGMYYIEGMPEGSYNKAVEINQKWQEMGIGEIRLVKSFKYHGKVYFFRRKGIDEYSAVMGSANLSVLKPDASTRRQYEICSITNDQQECRAILYYLKSLYDPRVSENISSIRGLRLIREKNKSLDGVELVSQIPPSSVDLYSQHLTETSFTLPLKVPAESEKLLEGRQYFTKSNVNVCYAAPRSKRKARDWYETQLTVSRQITTMDGYPEKNVPFFVVTDDGYWFKAHTTSSGNKQFSAVGDELIMGRWLKGRLAAAGLVKPVNDTGKDIFREGMITKEMLRRYGCDGLVFTKTDQNALDDDKNELDIWFLSFESLKSDD